ncbi:hypothetical protein [Paraburkholderia sacchari]|uniref:hypothetical protein n=1 Tax=Paraburkholderia sacchari TaxID=159450 RepID=UPI0005429167|nr:hypothetical protein [Paraburkholderia sacchari]NLP65549.1 hypothetical protein [Paraburkholderia sacchari]
MIGQVAQIGFDFGSNDSQSLDMDRGAWLAPCWDAPQWVRAIEEATRRLPMIDAQLCDLYRSGLDIAKGELADLIEEGADVSWRLSSIKLTSEGETVEKFMRACEQWQKAPARGIEVKVREKVRLKTAAVYIEGVGTIIALQWSQVDSAHIVYHPWKDSFFLSSFEDDMPMVKVPYATWKGAYCADKLAMSGNGVASVPTFKLNGREYVQTGGMCYGGLEQATAWRICPIADWNGETYSYRSITKAWDEGTRERGDERGMVVKVRGQLCVLESAINVYDERPSTDTIASLLAARNAANESDEETDEVLDEDEYDYEDEAAEPA